MYLMRFTPIIISLLLIIPLIQGKPTYRSSSANVKDYIKTLLNLIGIENEYSRFLSFLKIYPPNNNVQMKALYDDLFSNNAYISDLVRLYAKYYTLDEIIELITFYSSPVGKKSIQANNELHRQIEDTMLTKISDYIFTSAEHGFSIHLSDLK